MIGIVGGVGPYAGLDLARHIYDQTMATADQQHLSITLISESTHIPDRTEYLLGHVDENPGHAIATVIRKLEQTGATFAGIPCNTAHASEIFDVILQDLHHNDCHIEVVSLIESTIDALHTQYPHAKGIGVLSTLGTLHFGIYTKALKNAGFEPVLPEGDEEAKRIHCAIYDPVFGIKAHSNPVAGDATKIIESAATKLKHRGAELIVMGCTEIPLALKGSEYDGMPLVDPSKALARALIHLDHPEKLKSLT